MKFYESDYEEALIELLTAQGWEHTCGREIHRKNKEVLLKDDLAQYLSSQHAALTTADMEEIINHLRHTGGQTHFNTLRKTYTLVRDGFRYVRHDDGQVFDINFIDYCHTSNNIFRAVNQFEVGYGLEGKVRIPDVMLFVNGIPLCIFELKNPADAHATIADAYHQIHTRYLRDIPHLLRYCPLSCISDATQNHTKLGTTYTPYEHYYAWKKVHNEDPAAEKGLDQVRTIVAGVYAPSRLIEIFRDYCYFPDEGSGREEEIVCRYPQFFATRILRESIRTAYANHNSKGGTYFGATGCGKTYTMMFLARQLSLRCPELGSPTIVMIVDRDDLQSQAEKLFTRSTDYLSLGTAQIIDNRATLKTEMSARASGGFYICTIQKFCEEIGELNTRRNIICFSDEAHRTQLGLSTKLKIRNSHTAGNESKIGAFITKPYAAHLRTSFPNATFVGFTGTPIDETIQVFGEIVDRYTMQQAVDDEITVSIKYIPRIANVTLDAQKVKEIDQYYSQCAEEGATEQDIAASKKAMSAMEVILADDDRLERLCDDIIAHYTQACDNKPDVVQKAMIVCSKRYIGYKLLKKFQKRKPEWFEEQTAPAEANLTPEQLQALSPMPAIAMVATRGKDDQKDMYSYLGDKKRIKALDDAFKTPASNFRIAIVVDMWITGFDVPCLTFLYNDKPLQKHSLVQTISRVNRKFPGKTFGYIIDYIGIHKNMMTAMQKYGGEKFGPSEDDVKQALEILLIELEILKTFFYGFDISPFTNKKAKPIERLECLSNAADFVLKKTEKYNVAQEGQQPKMVDAKTFYLAHVRRLRTAYDICQPSNVLTHEQNALAQCFMAVAAYIRKTSGEKHDTESMNRAVERMVADALQYHAVVNILNTDVEENIFSPEFVAQIQKLPLPTTRLEVLVKMLRRAISQYKMTNKFAAEKYEEMLKKTLEIYHSRRLQLSDKEATQTQTETIDEILHNATTQALNILSQLGKDKESFRSMGLTFQEKAFYDILIAMRNKHNFEFGTDTQTGGIVKNDKCTRLAKKIKELIDEQSSYTDWLNNSQVRANLNKRLLFLLHTNGYPPTYQKDVVDEVLGQVNNYKTHQYQQPEPQMHVAKDAAEDDIEKHYNKNN